MPETRRTYGEIEGFVNMLLVACDDPSMNRTLEMLLSQPDGARKCAIGELLVHFREKNAPQPLIEAFACLLDDEVAEKAYEVIYQCAKKLK